MSVLPNSVTQTASAPSNDAGEQESFSKFFEFWIVEQDRHLQELISASRSRSESSSSVSRDEEENVLRPLINRVISQYEEYYGVKFRWSKQNVLAMLSPPWRSLLEDAFLWIGGWRPSMAFHLLYSKSGLQLESHLDDLIRGNGTGDLADLSPVQVAMINELQGKTIREEKEITEKMAKVQESVADSPMVELSHEVTEIMRGGGLNGNSGFEKERVKSNLGTKEEELEKMLGRADDLRLKTLKTVIDVLSPFQAVQFLIAAAELHLRLHDWGMKRDTMVGPTTTADPLTGEDH